MNYLGERYIHGYPQEEEEAKPVDVCIVASRDI